MGDLVLIDAGAQYLGYASDITRTYPVGGRLGPAQEELHSVVHAAQQAAIDRCRAGVEWRDVHLTAALVIAEGLVACGILRGDPESLVQAGAVSLFFPHGIGHLVGLGVRDAGGTPLPERRDDPKPHPNLRIDLPLEPGMVVTVEPGIYFVPAVIEDPDHRRRHRDEVAWDRVDRMLDSEAFPSRTTSSSARRAMRSSPATCRSWADGPPGSPTDERTMGSSLRGPARGDQQVLASTRGETRIRAHTGIGAEGFRNCLCPGALAVYPAWRFGRAAPSRPEHNPSSTFWLVKGREGALHCSQLSEFLLPASCSPTRR